MSTQAQARTRARSASAERRAPGAQAAGAPSERGAPEASAAAAAAEQVGPGSPGTRAAAAERGVSRSHEARTAAAAPDGPIMPRARSAAPNPPRRPNRANRVGRRGEQAAADYLRQRGYRLLERNWRSPDPEVRGELDLILRHRGTLVICEVKARTGSHLPHPAAAVTPEKAARLRRLAAVWLREHPATSRRPRPPHTAASPSRLPAPFALISRLLAPPPPPVHTATIRIDVVAVRLAPREPFVVLGIDHLIGVA